MVPDGVTTVAAAATYRDVAYAPDGIRATPSALAGDPYGPEASDLLPPTGGPATGRRWWDTAVVHHPSGRVLLSLQSDQGATLGLLERVDGTSTALLRTALVLDCDGYEVPRFTADGRFLVIRGDAYEHSVHVFEAATMTRVLALRLGDPSPGYPCPQEWLDGSRRWSRRNVAVAGAHDLVVGTPDGRLVHLRLPDRGSTEHDLPLLRDLTALTVTADGRVLVATPRAVGAVAGLEWSPPADFGTALQVAETLLSTTETIPDDADPWETCALTDGTRTWTPGDLDEVTETDEADPTWLQIQASVNRATD